MGKFDSASSKGTDKNVHMLSGEAQTSLLRNRDKLKLFFIIRM